jgi:hypothetical protein
LHNFTALWVNNNPSVDGFQDYFRRKPSPEAGAKYNGVDPGGQTRLRSFDFPFGDAQGKR